MIESLKTEAEDPGYGRCRDTRGFSGLEELDVSLCSRTRADLTVLSYTEIPDDQRIQVQSSIGGETAIEGETE